MDSKQSFHAGEREVQQRAGEAAIADRNIAVLTDTVIAGARPFIAKQFMVALSSIDAAGAVWASVVFGKPGFLHTPEGRTIRIDVPPARRDAADPLWTNLAGNPDLGMLFIELGSRRRYRVNGTLQALDEQGAEVLIREAYPNCPKYIQRRHLRQLGEADAAAPASAGHALQGEVADILRQTDTIFVASRHAETGADASHRGGAPGFVKLVDEHTLRIPDYTGNSLFNTFGNFHIDPRAGICVLDFAQGRMLQLTGTAAVLWDQADPQDETGGTKRYWEFKVEKWLLHSTSVSLEWEYLDASPFNPSVAAS